jgi:hypothetical protein
MEELLRNLHEAIEGCLSVDVAEPQAGARSAFLKSRYESAVWPRVRSSRRAARLAITTCERQPSHLGETRRRHAAIDPNSRKSPAQARAAASLGQARRDPRW